VTGDPDDRERKQRELARKNVQLAIALGLIALGIYLYFILRFAATR
jgi:uncharacterized membrane protein (DUF485 family)